MVKVSEALRIAEEIGLRVPKWRVIKSVKEVDIEPPFYAKVDTEEVHKTEKGLVKRIRRIEELEELLKYGEVVIQEEVEGIELLLSARVDDNFGIVETLGLGGILVELVKLARNFEYPPKKELVISSGLPVYEFRGKRLDFECLYEAMLTLPKALTRFKMVEVNPLILSEKGCWAVDVKLYT